MPLPPNDSPFWPILRDSIRLCFAIIAGLMIYNTVDFAKDFKMILALLLGNGLVSGGTGLIKKVMSNKEKDDSNSDQDSG